jgi:CTP synthase (UTP-ammonia lyase)
MKPIIGIPLRSDKDERDRPLEYLFDSVRRSVIKSGGLVLPLSPPQDVDYIFVKGNELPPLTDDEKESINFFLDCINGLLIPGGLKFSEYDRYLLEEAIKQDIPILGICLGMQIMSCYQMDVHMEPNADTGITHIGALEDHYMHRVRIDKSSKLYKIIGEEDIPVNSFHKYHATPNSWYKAVAFSEDGLIEAIESPDDKFNFGIQWHPEKMLDYDESARKLLNAFIEAASKRQTLLNKKGEKNYD